MPTKNTQKNTEHQDLLKKGWRRVKLGDVCEITSSKRIFLSEYVPEGVPFFRSKEIINLANNSEIVTELFITRDKYENIKNKFGIPQKGDLLITSVGTLGVVWLVDDREFYFKDGNLIWFKNFSKEVSSVYVHLLLRNIETQESLKKIAIGSSQKAFTIDSIKNFQINLPPLPEQKKIAEVLSAYDDLIEVNNKKIKTLETLAQTLYKEYFIKPTKNGLPSGWEEKLLGDICDLKKDKFQDNHKNLPLVDMSRINSKNLSITNIGSSEELSTSRIIFKEDDILFGSIRCYLHKVALAPFEGITNVSIFVLRSKEEFFKSFLYCHISNENTLKWADQNSSGTKMPVIKWDVFKNKKISLPKNEVLIKFNDLVYPFFEEIKLLSIENQNLQKTRDILIPQLVGGRVEVK